MRIPAEDQRCPCGTGEIFGACCAPVLRGDSVAPTAEALMRSRFTAFAVGDREHLLATWHPSSRPATLDLSDSLMWQRLDILNTEGGPFDDVAHVEFAAQYRSPPGTPVEERIKGVQRENSRFVRERGRWYYVDGDLQG
ncbi:YchJ family protein [Kocuria sp. HSID16901]|uniref:YchJ family protein n=1 Tax=Kocuria sp. HSID16901 TaxID=2419505 RepID=UPI00065F71E4|nr:YchJ family metal-binding protein [Kocuria sp. HSID16901]MCT1366900.1 YchJ family metal-binding protein [Rothia sp. p3-SID1597]RUQ20088.1 hypothetical protein D8M21_10470 [Kocuria sp. HSID16901]